VKWEGLAAGPNGREQAVREGSNQDNPRGLRRLLKCFQNAIGGFFGHGFRLINDKKPKTPFEGSELDFPIELPHRVWVPAILSNVNDILVGLEKPDIRMMTGGFFDAGRTGSTQVVLCVSFAIGHGRQAQGQRLLSYTLRAREKAGLGKLASTQDLDHLLITNKVSQSHGMP
jgi:hypothetical protein